MRLWLIELEAHEQRYTGQWKKHLPNLLESAARERGKDVEIVRIGQEASIQEPTRGAFLNFAQTNIFKSQQAIEIAQAFDEEDVKSGDVFLLTDAWNPCVIMIRYMSDLLKVPVEIHGIWHAGSYDPNDFLGREIKNKRWSYVFERSLLECYDLNYVATDFHKEMITKALNPDVKDWARIVRTGFPFEFLKNDLAPYANRDKRDLILFPHRIAPEKQRDIFGFVAEMLPEYEFITCQEQSLSKDEYHELLGQARMIFSANLQETLGISMYEGLLCGAVPFVPDRLSYKEIYSDRYPSEYTLSLDDAKRHEAPLKSEIVKRLDSYDREVLQNESERVGKQFFSATVMYDRLFK